MVHIELFGRRMEVARRIGEYKKENGLNILDSAREEEKLRWVWLSITGPASGATASARSQERSRCLRLMPR